MCKGGWRSIALVVARIELAAPNMGDGCSELLVRQTSLDAASEPA